MKPRVGSLFTGTGMLDHGVAQFFDTELAWVAEYEPPTKQNPKPRQAPARILAHHYPDILNHGDIAKINWREVDPVDILTLGFPCQDVSLAGGRAGFTVDSRSGMWSHGAAAIAAMRPSLVFIENVRGLLSAKAGDDEEITDDEGWTDDEIAQIEAERTNSPGVAGGSESREGMLGEPARDGGPILNAFGSVLLDLAELGYVAVWAGVQASDAGAPHARFRVFIVARPADDLASRDWPRTVENPDRATRGERRFAASREEEEGGAWPDARGRGRASAAEALAQLLPTPTVNMLRNENETVEDWEARRARVKETGKNGNGFGDVLTQAVQRFPGDGEPLDAPLFPTPQVADAEGGHRSRSGEKLLPGVVELFPTPSTSNANGNQTNNRGELLLPGVAESLPSPRLLRTVVAAEGTKATTRQGVDQKSESGQVWLTNEVHDLPTPDKQPGGIDLIPTPTSRDWKDGAENPNVPTNSLLGRTVWDSELPDGAPENSVEAYEQLWDSLEDQSPFWKTEKADYWPAIYRWALIMGRKAPAPTIPDGKGGRFRLSARFAEWMMGMPLGWVTACGLTRNEELKACGNGVVHQQAALALHVLIPMLWELAA